MATKTLKISEEAYLYLKGIKGEQTFSEVILSLIRSDNVMHYAGSLRNADFGDVQDIRKKINSDWATRI